MSRVLLQAGHLDLNRHRPLPPYTGAPGEAMWAADIAERLGTRLVAAGHAVKVIGAWNDTINHTDAPAAVHQDYALFVSLHYDGSTDPTRCG